MLIIAEVEKRFDILLAMFSTSPNPKAPTKGNGV